MKSYSGDLLIVPAPLVHQLVKHDPCQPHQTETAFGCQLVSLTLELRLMNKTSLAILTADLLISYSAQGAPFGIPSFHILWKIFEYLTVFQIQKFSSVNFLKYCSRFTYFATFSPWCSFYCNIKPHENKLHLIYKKFLCIQKLHSQIAVVVGLDTREDKCIINNIGLEIRIAPNQSCSDLQTGKKWAKFIFLFLYEVKEKMKSCIRVLCHN